MVRAHTARFLVGAVFCVALASGIAACNSEGNTAACHTADGGELPLFDINEVDDSGVHPNTDIEDRRIELAKKDCLTAVGHATSPEDSGSD